MTRFSPFQNRLILRFFTLIIVPLTIFSLGIAIGSIFLHERVMRQVLPEETLRIAVNPWLEITLMAPLVLIPPLVFSVGTLWFVTYHILRPLQRLGEQAANLAWGNFEAIRSPVGGIREIQDLQGALVDMAERVNAAQEGLRDYIGAITAAQEEERARLARELHDDTLQAIIALRQRLQLTRKSLTDPVVQRMLTELESLSEQTIENLRRMTRALRPIYLEDLGLVTALEMLTREVGQNHHLKIAFSKLGQERRLPAEVEISLYRIAQEALNNVVRHARASRAEVLIAFSPQEVRLEICDDGIGFQMPRNPADFARQGHFGLLGMRERAELIGARLEVDSVPGNGTRITLRL